MGGGGGGEKRNERRVERYFFEVILCLAVTGIIPQWCSINSYSFIAKANSRKRNINLVFTSHVIRFPFILKIYSKRFRT